ncbi:MAG: NAD(P)-dependent oxidoreductase [Gammaproteobacteria bacterium]
MTLRVGFIGLGDIGEPMAACVLAGGYQVTSCAHRRREAIERLKKKGMEEVDAPDQVGKRSDVLITMVRDDEETDRVLRGDNGALSNLEPGSVIVIMSTISPGYCQSFAAEAEKQGVNVLDCPVSGGPTRAEQGALALICGGPSDVIDHCRPTLETMGTLHNCGSIGMGQVAKLANQGMLIGNVRLVDEARLLASSYGLDLKTIMAVLAQSTGTSWALENWDFLASAWPHLKPLAEKDLKLCLAAAYDKKAPMPLTEARAALVWDIESQSH